MYRAKERSGCFVVSGSYCPVMFKLFKEVLNQMAGFVEGFIIVALNLSVRFWRYNNLFSGHKQRFNYARVCVISLIRQQSWGLKIANQMIRAVQVAGLPAGQEKPQRVAQSIASCMNFGA